MPCYMSTGGRRIPAEEWAHALHRICRCVHVDTSLPPGTAADRVIDKLKTRHAEIEALNQRIDILLNNLEEVSQRLLSAVRAPAPATPCLPAPALAHGDSRYALSPQRLPAHGKRVSARARHPQPRTQEP